MHIESLSLFHVALPRKTPQVIAGRPCETLDTVLVKLTSGGMVGWGEAAPGNAPTGNSEWAAGAFAVLRDWLAPVVVKTEIDSGKTLAERLAPFQHVEEQLRTTDASRSRGHGYKFPEDVCLGRGLEIRAKKIRREILHDWVIAVHLYPSRPPYRDHPDRPLLAG